MANFIKALKDFIFLDRFSFLDVLFIFFIGRLFDDLLGVLI